MTKLLESVELLGWILLLYRTLRTRFDLPDLLDFLRFLHFLPMSALLVLECNEAFPVEPDQSQRSSCRSATLTVELDEHHGRVELVFAPLLSFGEAWCPANCGRVSLWKQTFVSYVANECL